MTIDRDRLKRILGPTALVLLIVVVGLVLASLARVQERSNEGADPADALTEVPAGVPALRDVVEWQPDGELQERAVEPATRRAVEAAWTRAWQAQQRAAAGDPSLLDTWFSGPALSQVEALTGDGDTPVDLRLGTHELTIDFYSDDGSVLGLRADPVRVIRSIETPVGPVVTVTDEAYDVVFLLEDGNWRIRQWQRTASTVVPVD